MPKLEGREKKLETALRLHNDGKKMSEILEITELGYSLVWLFIADAELPAAQRIKESDRTGATVRKLRDEEDNSWGLIQVRFGFREYTEGRIRKMYEEASGVKAIGLRIGRGGRFLNGDQVLYAGDRRKPGIRLSSDTKRSEISEISGKLAQGMGVPRKAAGVTKKVVGAVKKAAVSAPPTKKAAAKKIAAKKATSS